MCPIHHAFHKGVSLDKLPVLLKMVKNSLLLVAFCSFLLMACDPETPIDPTAQQVPLSELLRGGTN